MRDYNRLFNETAWGTSGEHDALLEMGRCLALPLFKPELSYKELRGLSEYQQYAVELTAGILCAFVYKNSAGFNFNRLLHDLPACLLEYMKTARVIKDVGRKYKVTNYAKFGKWMEKINDHELPETYRITTVSKSFKFLYEELVDEYYKNSHLYSIGLGRVHPFSYYITGFINRTDCSDTTAVLAIKTMLDGLTYLTEGNVPETRETELKNDIKRAYKERSAYLQEVYYGKKQ